MFNRNQFEDTYCLISYSFRVIVFLHRGTLKALSPSHKRNKEGKGSKKTKQMLEIRPKNGMNRSDYWDNDDDDGDEDFRPGLV